MRTGRMVAAAALSASGVAVALAPSAAQASSGTAMVSVVHGIPKVAVDVYVNNKLTLKHFTFDKVAGPLNLPAGSYSLAVRAAGAKATSAPLLKASLMLKAGENATVIAHLSAKGAPTLQAFADPTAMLAKGKARVSVRHLADAPAVDVYAGTTKVVSNLSNAHQAVLVIPAGKVAISVDVAGTMKKVIGPATFNFAAGTTTIVNAVGNAATMPSTLTVAVQSYM